MRVLLPRPLSLPLPLLFFFLSPRLVAPISACAQGPRFGLLALLSSGGRQAASWYCTGAKS